jgi:hypothetical protein
MSKEQTMRVSREKLDILTRKMMSGECNATGAA